MDRILNFEDYTIAWIAVLPIEAEAALGMLDNRHNGQFETVRGDDYIYIGGDINGHNVVIATWPEGQNYGVGSAAALANQVKARFANIYFALLVGVAAGLPNLSPKPPAKRRDIRLGDVLVSAPEKGSVGIVHYDLGQDTEEDFLPNGRQAETPAIVRSAIGNIKLTKKNPFRSGNDFSRYLVALQKEDEDGKFICPRQEKDQFFEYVIEGNNLVQRPVRRDARDELERTRVWYGNIGSGNSLMRNPRRRDELRDEYDLIGLETEAAGIMNTLPTGVIRGVCDYGDAKKNKDWQPYAAAVAAAYAKGVLYTIKLKASQAQLGHVASASDTNTTGYYDSNTAAADSPLGWNQQRRSPPRWQGLPYGHDKSNSSPLLPSPMAQQAYPPIQHQQPHYGGSYVQQGGNTVDGQKIYGGKVVQGMNINSGNDVTFNF
ncbi:MAG: hypothetical protein M1813_003686 [Trichoglossum hirsutum]|nr:MAG: hypothetical protein M1813_003686 [Trichoglossum hirsutum]